MTAPLTPSEFLAAVGMDREGKTNRMRRFGDALVAEWAATARRDGKMKSTLGPYVKAIAIRGVTENSVTVELPAKRMTGKAATVVRMIEFGMGPGGIGTEGSYDVRKFLLSGAGGKTKMGKTGPYKNVPFKPTTAEIKGLGGKSALEKAKGLAATRVSGGSWQGPSLAAGHTAIINNANTGLPHKTDRLHGLRRMVNKRGKTSRYITFRRASWSGNPWIHRGVRARHLAEKVRGKVQEVWERVS